MHAFPQPLLSESANSNQGYLFTGGGYSPYLPPNEPNYGEWADEVTVNLRLIGVTGAPTAWSVGIAIDFIHPHTSLYQFQKPAFFTPSTENIAASIVEGKGFYGGAHPAPLDGGVGILADNTDPATSGTLTTPVMVQRTLRHFGLGFRLRIVTSVTGGTSPRYIMSAVFTPKIAEG